MPRPINPDLIQPAQQDYYQRMPEPVGAPNVQPGHLVHEPVNEIFADPPPYRPNEYAAYRERQMAEAREVGTARTAYPGDWNMVGQTSTSKPKPKTTKTTRETRIDYIMMAHKILSSTRNKTIDDVLNTAEAIEVYINSGPRKAASRENVEGISLD